MYTMLLSHFLLFMRVAAGYPCRERHGCSILRFLSVPVSLQLIVTLGNCIDYNFSGNYNITPMCCVFSRSKFFS